MEVLKNSLKNELNIRTQKTFQKNRNRGRNIIFLNNIL